MLLLTVEVYHPGDKPPYHVYEAVQIFHDVLPEPVFVPHARELSLVFSNCAGKAENEKTDSENADIHRERILSEEEISAQLPAGGISACGGYLERDPDKWQKRQIYQAISRFTGYTSPWGCMTGIRPAKIVNRLLEAGLKRQEVAAHLKDFYLCREDKCRLAIETAVLQAPFLAEQRRHPEHVGVYVGIPFCPSRCLYCSFPSHSIQKYGKSVEPYLNLLEQELAAAAALLDEKGLAVESLYLGGGTPTALNEVQFARYMEMLRNVFARHFTSGTLREFSLEAGRPDSITRKKLRAAKETGVNRISINPQTMQDATLLLIGRQHTAKDIRRAYAMAREEGFSNINMDLIAGLPGETADDFRQTLTEIGRMGPEAVTVHTLSIKRAAILKYDEKRNLLTSGQVGEMVSDASRFAADWGMRPFYMYRQKHMLGNHENVAYCRSGCESLYNIHIMEEDQTILAAGAGGVSKAVFHENGQTRIERAFNVKSVEDYLARMPEMIARKRRLLDSI